MICPVCGGLRHVGLQHLCVLPEGAEFGRRKRRAERLDGRLNASFNERMARVLSDMAARVAQEAKAYAPRASLERDPIRVQAYVGRPLLELSAGQGVIDVDIAD